MSTSAQVVDFGLAAIAREVARLPKHWAFIPVGGNKAPQYSGWQHSRFTTADFDKAVATGVFEDATCKAGEPDEYWLPASRVKAAGVLCGEPSGGLLFFDHDGYSGDAKILELSGQSTIANAMPRTAAVTSGRKGRYQAIYQVAEKFWSDIETTKIGTKFETKPSGQVVAVEGIEFRWTGAQSVVVGVHPETGGYRWYYHPADIPIAEAPLWMIEAMLSEPQSEDSPQNWTEFDKTFSLPCDYRVSLLVACAPKTRKAIEQGATDKGRNDTGAQIARDLLGTANYLDSIGQMYEGDPRRLFQHWCDCYGLTQDKPRGQPNTIWTKAEKDRPSPSLNPTQIEGCLKSWVWKNAIDSHTNAEKAQQQAKITSSESSSSPEGALTADDLRVAIAKYSEIKDPFERHMFARQIKSDFRASNADLSNLSRALKPLATTGAEGLDSILRETFNEIEQRADGKPLPVIQTGFLDLDRKLIGFKKKHLIILGGRSAMGKTAMAVALSLSAARQNKRVLFISLEMTKQEISERMISNLSSVNSRNIQTGEIPKDKWDALGIAISKLSRLQVVIDDTPRLPVIDIEELALEHKADIVFVDHALKLDAPGRDDRERVVYITGFLKDMAKRINTPVILLSQINREVQKQSNKRPSMADLKQSGSLEEDADVILLMYREEYYEPDTTTDRGVAEVIIGKHRNGPVGTVKLLFEPEYSRFRNLATRIG
ncbi:MAG: hypothetical protein F6K11_14240 [Leptolyngbya sp. SIO3F4]|nr:hypothetical protein [Leptolyngbya sp. SIO3F4]